MNTVSFFHSSRVIACSSFIALSAFAVSCKDNDDAYDLPTFSISSTTVVEPREGSEVKVDFSTNRRWSVTTNATWLSVSPASGQPGEGFILKALENTGVARSATLVLRYGSRDTTLTVSQAAGEVTPEKPQEFAGMHLSDFIAKYDKGSDVTVTDDDSFQAVVLSDTQANNVVGLKNITVQAGNVGISVRLNSNNTYKPGELLTFKAKGAKITRAYGGLQIDYTGLTSGIESTGTIQTVTPIKATLSDIYAGKYENVLVTVEGVQFRKAGGKLNTDAKRPYYHSLTDCVTEVPSTVSELSVAISAYFPQKGETVSDKNGSITGILARGNNKGKTAYNLWIRSLADINLTATACTPKADNNSNKPSEPVTPSKPTEPTTPVVTPSGSDLFISAYVEGSGSNKYIQIYNPTDKAVDLSAYKLVLEAYGAKNTLSNGMPKDFPLSGTLAAGATLVFKNGQAKLYSGDATVSEVTYYNGNDNVALYKGTTLIDVVGTWGQAWVGGKNGAGADVTLHRKASISKGNTTYTASEWDVLKVDDVSVLGKR